MSASKIAPTIEVTVEYQNERAWKYEGYPAFSKWIATSDDLMLFRRFEHLNARVLLGLQARLIGKEKELLALDDEAKNKPDDDPESRSDIIQHDPFKRRRKHMEEMQRALKEYNDYLASYLPIQGLPAAQKYQADSLKSRFKRYTGAITAEEQEFASDDDLMALAGSNRSPLRVFLEKWSSLLTSSCFRDRDRIGDVESGTTVYLSDRRIEAFITGLFIMIGLIFLFAPMWWLEFVHHSTKRLGVITGFVLMFTVFVGYATDSTPSEVLGATAAYTGVLMVYLGNA